MVLVISVTNALKIRAHLDIWLICSGYQRINFQIVVFYHPTSEEGTLALKANFEINIKTKSTPKNVAEPEEITKNMRI